MTRHRADNPLLSLAGTAARLTTAVLVIGLAGAVVSSPAAAAGVPETRHTVRAGTDPGDPYLARMGNGKHNSLYLQVSSPTYMFGVQHKSNASVQGSAPSQSAFCKRKRVCYIRESQTIFHGHGRGKRRH
ncbi:hypothetical protein [Sphaerisporangium album]|nr:hypothetical protein [Sphaerisporangium album]